MRTDPSWLTLVPCLAVLCSACGDEASEPGGGVAGGPPDTVCPAPERLVDGECLPPGVQDDGCAAGTVFMDDGSCRAAGVPPERCAEGFEPLGDGCEPILPADPCPPGQMAVPGDASCRPVMSCGAGPWGDLPVDGSTEYVDGSYTGGNSDGSADRPWTTIAEGLLAATDGSLVAVAAGSYVEDLSIRKPIRLWGVCPEQVEVVATGDAPSAVAFSSGAVGAEVGGLAVTGDAYGVGASGTVDAVVDRVWVHHTGAPGIAAVMTSARPCLAVRDSLVDQAGDMGVLVSGALLTLESTVVRDTQPAAGSQLFGRGLYIVLDEASGTPAQVVVRRSLIQGNREAGVAVLESSLVMDGTVVRGTLPPASGSLLGAGVWAEHVQDDPMSVLLRSSLIEANYLRGVTSTDADLTVEATVIRDTVPAPASQVEGIGVIVQNTTLANGRPRLTISDSLLERNHALGLDVDGAEVSVRGTTVRGTLPQVSDGTNGRGINIEESPDTGETSTLVMVGSVVEGNHQMGVFVANAHASILGSVVRDTQTIPAELESGMGITIQDDGLSPHGASLELRTSVVEGNRDVGLFLLGAPSTVEATVIRGTRPASGANHSGRGISLQHHEAAVVPASLILRWCTVTDNVEFGLTVIGADAQVESCRISQTVASEAGHFGDGIATFSMHQAASLHVQATEIVDSARVGLSNFGAFVSVGSTTLQCQAFDLDREPWDGREATFEDRGDNRCGCPTADGPCTAVSAGLDPPVSLPPP